MRSSIETPDFDRADFAVKTKEFTPIVYKFQCGLLKSRKISDF
jgi:hypothetical protein